MNLKKPQFFGTDGIRGIVGNFPLVPEFILQLGAATGIVLHQSTMRPTVIIGRDTRQSGQMLQSALTAGLLSAGVSVIDVGVIPTPGVAFLVKKLGAEAGIVISASHNPFEQNGIKIINAQGGKLTEDRELEIEEYAANPGFGNRLNFNNQGRSIDGEGMRELYLDSLMLEQANLDMSQLKIVLDCANGAASWYAPECFARLGAQTIVIHASPTGSNINHQAGSEQIRKHPEELHKLILQYEANFGIAFDGDADRAVFVDESGSLVDGDHMLGFLADHFHRHDKLLADTIVSTSMRNQGLVDYLSSRGYKFIETKVGDKYVTEEITRLSVENFDSSKIGLGGEQAGHIILYDQDHVSGDGIRTALYVIRALLEADTNRLAELASRINKTPQIIASAFVSGKPDLNNIAELQALKTSLDTRLPGLERMELRYSGTEPLFRAMLEGSHSLTEQQLANVAWDLCRSVQRAAGMQETKEARIEILNVTRGGLLTKTK